MNDSLSISLVILIILIVVFIILREVNCWYWKINKRIDLLEKQNLLIEKILNHLKGISPSEIKENDQKHSDEATNRAVSNLSDEERREYDKFIKFGLKDGEKIVIHKKKRKIDRFTEEEWNGILYKNQENEWQILFEK